MGDIIDKLSLSAIFRYLIPGIVMLLVVYICHPAFAERVGSFNVEGIGLSLLVFTLGGIAFFIYRNTLYPYILFRLIDALHRDNVREILIETYGIKSKQEAEDFWTLLKREQLKEDFKRIDFDSSRVHLLYMVSLCTFGGTLCLLYKWLRYEPHLAKLSLVMFSVSVLAGITAVKFDLYVERSETTLLKKILHDSKTKHLARKLGYKKNKDAGEFGVPNMPLFQPDKYQRSKPVFCNASDADRRQVSVLLSECYGISLDSGYNIEQVRGAEINSNNFRVETSDQRLLVKRFSCSKCRSLLKRKLLLYQWLRGQGIPVPIVFENVSQRLLTSHAEHYWCVMEFIKGTYFAGKDREIEEAARVTERLFNVLTEARKELVPDDRMKMLYPSEGQELMAQVENMRGKWDRLGDEAASALSDGWDTIKDSVDRFAIEESSVIEYSSLSHVDLHPYNLLFNADRVVAILDFESFRMAPPLVMVSFSAYKLLRHAAVYRKSHHQDMHLQSLVTKYRSSLSCAEFLPVQAGTLARAEILRRLFYILNGSLIENDPEAEKWLGDVPMHVTALQEVQHLFPVS